MRASTPPSAIALRTAVQRRSSSASDIGLSSLSFISRPSRMASGSHAVIGTKPIDKLLDAHSERRIGGKSHRFSQVLHVRAGLVNVARLHRHQFPDRPFPKRRLEQAYHFHEIYRGVV